MKTKLIFTLFISLLLLSSLVTAEETKITLKEGQSFTVGGDSIKLIKVDDSSVIIEHKGEESLLREGRNIKVGKSTVTLTNSLRNTIDPSYNKAVFLVYGDDFVNSEEGETSSSSKETVQSDDYVNLRSRETAKIGDKIIQLVRITNGKALMNINGELKEFSKDEVYESGAVKFTFESIADNRLDETFDRVSLKLPKGLTFELDVEPYSVVGADSEALVLPTGFVIKQKIKDEAIALDAQSDGDTLVDPNKEEENTAEETPSEETTEDPKEETEQEVEVKDTEEKEEESFITKVLNWFKGLFFSEGE